MEGQTKEHWRELVRMLFVRLQVPYVRDRTYKTIRGGIFECSRLLGPWCERIAMPFNVSQIDGQAYQAACERVRKSVGRLVDARGGLAMSVAVDPGRAHYQARIDTHKIHITYRGVTCVVAVDHDTFMNAEFFRTLVLHQVEAVIAELAWSQDTSPVELYLQSSGT